MKTFNLLVLAALALSSSAYSQEIKEPAQVRGGFLGDLSGQNGAYVGLSSRSENISSRFKKLYASHSTEIGVGLFGNPDPWSINQVNISMAASEGKWLPVFDHDVGLILGVGSALDIYKMPDRDFNRSTWSMLGSVGVLGGDSADHSFLLKGNAGIVLVGNDATRGGGFGAVQFEGESAVSFPAFILGGSVRYVPGKEEISETELRVSGTLNLNEVLSMMPKSSTLTVAYSSRMRKEIDDLGLTHRKDLDQLKVTFGYPLN